MIEREPVGRVIDNSAYDSFTFVVEEGKHVQFGNYYVVRHPSKEVDVLTRIIGLNYRNPEMDVSRYGPRYAKKGLTLPASDQEILLATAEPLGYFDGDKFRPLEVPPPTWTPVYEASEGDLQRFIAPSGKGYYLGVGRIRNTDVPFSLDINGLVKGHCFICGMTRSGKSTFLLSLAEIARKELDPPLHLMIFDRRGEYGPLAEKLKAKQLPYTSFLKPFSKMDPRDVMRMLGIGKGKLQEYVTSGVEKMQSEGAEPTVKNLETYVFGEIESKATGAYVSRYIATAKDSIRRYGSGIEKLPRTSKDPVAVMGDHDLSLVDFSVDTNISRQQIVASDIVSALLRESMSNDDFGGIVAIEEIQYFAPEEIMVKYGDNWRRSRDAIVEAVSQGGGYNLSFVIMTQRPAYVSKSVISQCNTVVSFRLMSWNDQQAIINYSEYGSKALAKYLSGLADHEALVAGIALPCRFPVIVETRVEDYPRKATKDAKQTFEAMRRGGPEKAEAKAVEEAEKPKGSSKNPPSCFGKSWYQLEECVKCDWADRCKTAMDEAAEARKTSLSF